MEYMSSQAAAEQWNITLRQVQNLCRDGRIPGTVRFGRSWAIPRDARKPVDGRRRGAATDQVRRKPDAESLPFRLYLDRLPYPVNVLSPDGTMVYANDAFMEGVLDDVRDSVIGHFNVNDEPRQDAWGVGEHLRRALKGEHVFTLPRDRPRAIWLHRWHPTR
jgi:PAS domain-containing protein